MRVEGLWTIQFSETAEDYGGMSVKESINRGGTLVLANGRVYGAGLSFFFVGRYEVEGNLLNLELTANRYNDLVEGALGVGDQAQLVFQGSIEGDEMKLKGRITDDEDKMIYIGAIKRADLQEK